MNLIENINIFVLIHSHQKIYYEYTIETIDRTL